MTWINVAYLANKLGDLEILSLAPDSHFDFWDQIVEEECLCKMK